MKPKLRIALPKGRMSDETLEFFTERKILSQGSAPTGRELIFQDSSGDFEFLLIRSKDVGTYVEQGAADMGIMGLDLLTEHRFDVNIVLPLPFGDCHLSVAHRSGHTEWRHRRNIRVATKYPHISSVYFFNRGFNIEIIQLYGSIEIAPITGISDVITDLVSTGATLKANGLQEEEQIMHSTAHLILNRAAYVHKRQFLNEIIDALS
ncbi:MAG: ATP phosphoribosyltransferase [Leptospiraceae bacterium]|nr:ATP phosphoribosyltransferase [Leptospiraceae bacterium]